MGSVPTTAPWLLAQRGHSRAKRVGRAMATAVMVTLLSQSPALWLGQLHPSLHGGTAAVGGLEGMLLDDRMDPEFLQQLEKFCSYIWEQSPPKSIPGGCKMTGESE